MSLPRLYLLDTNTCVFIMNEEPKQVRGRMVEVTEEGHTLAISSVTLHELWFGVWRSSRQSTNAKRLGNFISGLHVFPFEDSAAEKAAEVRAGLASTGKPIGPYDQLIAGHAIALKAILVTNNLSEFRRIEGLKVEDWVTKE
ncbi:type II toxin-antitoxin system VapC family toxin [Deinococcus sp. YIM 134068]|uniref:type II toxin-antitoxin system tRNA(fMet)-specific endonuclease VapC n=1 Tax=Deinococcus lichenicola TaxID=3118910 RepID=UPI002F93C8B3